MKRNHLLALAIMVAMIAAIVGTPFQSAQAQGKALVVWMTGSDDDATAFKAAADLWAKKSGGSVTVEAVSWSDAYAKMLAAATSGQGPDLVTGGLSFGIQLGAKGGMVNLNENYKDAVAAIKKGSNQGIWSSIVSQDGSLFGVPYDLTTMLFYYRPDVLEKAGIKAAPKTWDELIAAAKAVRKMNGDKGGIALGWGGPGWLQYSNFLYQSGGDFYSADCKTVTVNDEKGVSALNYFASLFKEGGASTDASDTLTGFADGSYPLMIDGSWQVGSIDTSKPEIKGKWAVALLPAGPSGKSTAFIGGRIIGIMKASKNVDAAMDLINFLNTPDAAKAIIDAAFAKNAIFFPPQTDFAQYMKAGETNLKAIAAQLADAKGPSPCPGFEETNKELETQLQNVILKDADVKDALDTAAEAMTEGLTVK